MKSNDDLCGEYFQLLKEQADLREACLQEWGVMSVQVARTLNARLLEIPNELAKLKRAADRRHMIWPPEQARETA